MNELDTFQSKDFSSDYRLRALYSMIPRGGVVLDVGSGNGMIANILQGQYRKFILTDNSETLINQLRLKFHDRSDVEIHCEDAQHLNPHGAVDVITACDILEHISHDAKSVRSLAGALSPGGRLFISVPAHPFLYGLRDEKYGHIRRYKKKNLRELLTVAGLEIESIRHWNAIGVIPYLISEKIARRPLVAPARDKNSNMFAKIANQILFSVLYLETFLPFPFGLSLIAICRKKQ